MTQAAASNQASAAQAAAPFVRPPLTKIVATIGPASSDADMVRKLTAAGVSVYRLNFSHGSSVELEHSVRVIRETSAELDRPVAILGDLPGPKMRVGEVCEGGINVPAGATVIFQRETIVADGSTTPIRFSTTYDDLIDDVEPGHRLLVNDGMVRMLVVDRQADAVVATVTHGGLITSGKGVNLPDTTLSLPALGERDWRWVEWAIAHDIDMLALSFVTSAEAIELLRTGIESFTGKPDRLPIIAKIERPAAVGRIDEIVAAAHGVMIARGDLGVEMDLASVPVIQRRIVQCAQSHGKPCIVATQMLESMIHRPQPTRAEASDVANAIFDEVDAVMLSGETAVGQYPLLAVDTARRIAEETEAHLAATPARGSPPSRLVESRDPLAALAHGAAVIAMDVEATLIAAWSEHGDEARLLSQNSLHLHIIAGSADERALRQMTLFRSVTPLRMHRPNTLDAFVTALREQLLPLGWAKPGDRCVIILHGAVAVASL